MSTSAPTPGDDRRRWEMSPGEKLIAQWEAQHDVAARGSRCDPLGLQHQLSRERLADRTRPPSPRTPAGATASRAADEPAPAEAAHPEPPTARRHPWRRFHHHASEH
ncbi:hypothetical protein JD79_03172 [Geodermatophilus normandii]|uniref:Uncharacterized protein n=1 Tax=Geodermatophilus normandii TaxID=1137989 RepID=A0A317QP76_9ACTN|nr:hypothetical protein [Geodermatophilus normandii]PWW23995.1 hypothetical protein JD79_03172 [Geodermatophilus normandii]